jgi:putative ABC transport system substrate-binding protein
VIDGVPGNAVSIPELLRALRERGWIDGETMSFVVRYAEGYLVRLPILAREVVALGPNVLVAGASTATRPVAEATATIPIVAVAFQDPDATAFVGDFNRPRGNVTGFIGSTPSQAGKLVDLAMEVIPRATRLGVLDWIRFTERAAIVSAVAEAAGPHRIEVQWAPLGGPEDIAAGFAALVQAHVDAVVVPPEALFSTAIVKQQLAAAAAANKMPTIYGYADFQTFGGLIGYGLGGALTIGGPNNIYYQGGLYVDRILRGAKVAELPVQFPTHLYLGINLKTAAGLGLVVPPSLLARADVVIE